MIIIFDFDNYCDYNCRIIPSKKEEVKKLKKKREKKKKRKKNKREKKMSK